MFQVCPHDLLMTCLCSSHHNSTARAATMVTSSSSCDISVISLSITLQTKVIGLNAWLVSIHIPNITLQCICGWPTQSVCHVLLFCSHCSIRDQLFANADTNNITQMLFTNKGIYAVTKWLISQKVL